MFFRILKRELKRKKTMNIILLLFIMLAAMFIASGINNMTSVMTALDGYFKKANVPDYWFATAYEEEINRYKEFAKENGYEYAITPLMQINPQNIIIKGEKFDYSNTSCVSAISDSPKVFDKNDNEVKHINDGEIYVTAEQANSDKNDFSLGNTITITENGKTKTFTIKGSVKDALFGSSMVGMTRFLISDNDYAFFKNEQSKECYSVSIYTNDDAYYEKYLNLELNTIFNINKSGIRMMYMMDMLMAAVFLVVSICLILISMVILRFTINFTMSEEFREIGVMKAIGLKCKNIRRLYIIKYLVISAAGASAGFALSIPFGNMMLKDVSENIVIQGAGGVWLNGVCAAFTAAVVVLFCFMCTGKIKRFSPIDAIRNGQSGERFKAKSRLSLEKSRIKPLVFMALNDILSEVRRFISMILIFALGLLLIVIPANTANTLQSEGIIKWFNMSECDVVLTDEMMLQGDGNTKEMLIKRLEEVKKFLKEENIEADVYQEVMFRMTVRKDNKKASSLAFIGINGVTCSDYDYLEGDAPQDVNEVAVTKFTCDKIDAHIGDYVYINNGKETKKYIITAIYQSLNNLGEGIRFYQEENLDFSYAAGCFGVQIRYRDNPDSKEIGERKNLLSEKYPGVKAFTAGEYANYMIGDVAAQIDSIKLLIFIVVAVINMLVTVLMVKSFITKEKNEIAFLKALGFKNTYIVGWQTLRIGIVFIISMLIVSAVSLPLSKLIITPIFRMMGAENMKFKINPAEIYIIYPVIIFLVTTLSAMLTALQARKITTSDISNTE